MGVQQESDGIVVAQVEKNWISSHSAVCHEVIKTACERFDEDTGKRPVHRPRVWRKRERRLEKEDKSRNWNKKKT